jgi:hypothetical protein
VLPRRAERSSDAQHSCAEWSSEQGGFQIFRAASARGPAVLRAGRSSELRLRGGPGRRGWLAGCGLPRWRGSAGGLRVRLQDDWVAGIERLRLGDGRMGIGELGIRVGWWLGALVG